MPARRRRDTLETYRARRTAGATPEPFGEGAERPGLFVVQLHAARRLHYDVRLEIGGVLRSWAVPKGPSLDPADKRFAAETEDHPIEYGDFEGVIPPGNYGAGTVVVWDRGRALHHLDPEAGLESGKLLFELLGYKLRGLWTLVRTKREREWLLIKKPDAAASSERGLEELGEESVLSGLTLEEMRDGSRRGERIETRLEELGARRRRLAADEVRPMLARLERRPFDREGWLFELKYDGYRVLAEATGGGAGARGRARLVYRSGRSATSAFPEITRALSCLPYERLVVDGEVVVLDSEARPDFQALQKRARLRRRPDLERAAVERPANLYLFDLLAFGDFDLRRLPLAERKALLREVVPRAGPLRFADHVEARGAELYREVRRRGLEGIVGKRADSRYRGGRGGDWVKIRGVRSGDFAVVGYTLPRGSRPGLGALHLGVHLEGDLVYAGRVGSGFKDAELVELRRRLERARRKTPPCGGAPATGRRDRWVRPRHVVEVRYSEVTESGQLRHPVFLRRRPDKRIADCVRDDLPPPEAPAAAGSGEVEVSRPEKVFWPAEGITKGELVDYYRRVGPWLLPYLADRPLVLDRYPDGIDGKSFFQKNAPEYVPDWVRTEPVWSEESGKETLYFVCDDLEALVYLVNLGTVPLHVWASRVGSLERPDWCVLDLDAKQASFARAVAAARQVGRLCRELGLEAFVKTSGATGLHVLAPLGAAHTFQQARQLAELLARVVAARAPDLVTLARSPSARGERVYLDVLQNGPGKLLVAPFSVRPLAGAAVSMPLRWRELRAGLEPGRFSLRSAPRRLARWKGDPMAPVLDARPDLPAVLARLAEILERLPADGAARLDG